MSCDRFVSWPHRLRHLFYKSCNFKKLKMSPIKEKRSLKGSGATGKEGTWNHTLTDRSNESSMSVLHCICPGERRRGRTHGTQRENKTREEQERCEEEPQEANEESRRTSRGSKYSLFVSPLPFSSFLPSFHHHPFTQCVSLSCVCCVIWQNAHSHFL